MILLKPLKSSSGFSKIYHFLELILMKHIELICSLESELNFACRTFCSCSVLSVVLLNFSLYFSLTFRWVSEDRGIVSSSPRTNVAIVSRSSIFVFFLSLIPISHETSIFSLSENVIFSKSVSTFSKREKVLSIASAVLENPNIAAYHPDQRIESDNLSF